MNYIVGNSDFVNNDIWIRKYDETSGFHYYEHKHTGESKWDPNEYNATEATTIHPQHINPNINPNKNKNKLSGPEIISLMCLGEGKGDIMTRIAKHKRKESQRNVIQFKELNPSILADINGVSTITRQIQPYKVPPIKQNYEEYKNNYKECKQNYEEYKNNYKEYKQNYEEYKQAQEKHDKIEIINDEMIASVLSSFDPYGSSHVSQTNDECLIELPTEMVIEQPRQKQPRQKQPQKPPPQPPQQPKNTVRPIVETSIIHFESHSSRPATKMDSPPLQSKPPTKAKRSTDSLGPPLKPPKFKNYVSKQERRIPKHLPPTMCTKRKNKIADDYKGMQRDYKRLIHKLPKDFQSRRLESNKLMNALDNLSDDNSIAIDKIERVQGCLSGYIYIRVTSKKIYRKWSRRFFKLEEGVLCLWKKQEHVDKKPKQKIVFLPEKRYIVTDIKNDIKDHTLFTFGIIKSHENAKYETILTVGGNDFKKITELSTDIRLLTLFKV